MRLLDGAAARRKISRLHGKLCARPIPGALAWESTMKPAEKIRFDRLYPLHLRALRLQGLSESTMDVYARAVRRLAEHYDRCPDRLTTEQLESYFAELVKSHSWSTVKVDRNGLQFFWKHVLKREGQWVQIIKAPRVRTLADILSVAEVERLIGATRNLRYRVFLLATYSMGLRLGDTLALEVGDIDGPRKQVISAGARATGPSSPASGPDLPGAASPVAQTSQFPPVVPPSRRLTGADSQRHHAHGSRRHPGCHEGRGAPMRDQKKSLSIV
jgi:integrase